MSWGLKLDNPEVIAGRLNSSFGGVLQCLSSVDAKFDIFRKGNRCKNISYLDIL